MVKIKGKNLNLSHKALKNGGGLVIGKYAFPLFHNSQKGSTWRMVSSDTSIHVEKLNDLIDSITNSNSLSEAIAAYKKFFKDRVPEDVLDKVLGVANSSNRKDVNIKRAMEWDTDTIRAFQAVKETEKAEAKAEQMKKKELDEAVEEYMKEIKKIGIGVDEEGGVRGQQLTDEQLYRRFFSKFSDEDVEKALLKKREEIKKQEKNIVDVDLTKPKPKFGPPKMVTQPQTLEEFFNFLKQQGMIEDGVEGLLKKAVEMGFFASKKSLQLLDSVRVKSQGAILAGSILNKMFPGVDPVISFGMGSLLSAVGLVDTTEMNKLSRQVITDPKKELLLEDSKKIYLTGRVNFEQLQKYKTESKKEIKDFTKEDFINMGFQEIPKPTKFIGSGEISVGDMVSIRAENLKKYMDMKGYKSVDELTPEDMDLINPDQARQRKLEEDLLLEDTSQASEPPLEPVQESKQGETPEMITNQIQERLKETEGTAGRVYDMDDETGLDADNIEDIGIHIEAIQLIATANDYDFSFTMKSLLMVNPLPKDKKQLRAMGMKCIREYGFLLDILEPKDNFSEREVQELYTLKHILKQVIRLNSQYKKTIVKTASGSTGNNVENTLNNLITNGQLGIIIDTPQPTEQPDVQPSQPSQPGVVPPASQPQQPEKLKMNIFDEFGMPGKKKKRKRLNVTKKQRARKTKLRGPEKIVFRGRIIADPQYQNLRTEAANIAQNPILLEFKSNRKDDNIPTFRRLI